MHKYKDKIFVAINEQMNIERKKKTG